jgi:hypothetical protein
MGKFTDLEIVILVALAIKKALTVRMLQKLIGNIAIPTLYKHLNSLKRKGLVQANRAWKQAFLDLPLPNEHPTPREIIHSLKVPLEQLWQYQEFQQAVNEIFGISDLDEVKSVFEKLNKEKEPGVT